MAVSEVDGANGLAVAGNYAYVAAFRYRIDTDDARYLLDGSCLRTVDVSDPTAPKETALYTLPYSIDAMSAVGDRLYVVGRYFGIRVLDVSALSLQEVASYTLASSSGFSDISVMENGVYISGWKFDTENDPGGEGVWLLDTANPAGAGFHRVAEDAVYSMPLADPYILVVKSHVNEGFIASHTFAGSLQRMDGGDPLTIVETGSVDLLSNVLDMAASRDHLYVAYGLEGLQAIDISDPTSPTVAGFYNTDEGVWGVATNSAAEDYLYVIDRTGVVSILKFTPN